MTRARGLSGLRQAQAPILRNRASCFFYRNPDRIKNVQNPLAMRDRLNTMHGTLDRTQELQPNRPRESGWGTASRHTQLGRNQG
jgi:hypothetical protein